MGRSGFSSHSWRTILTHSTGHRIQGTEALIVYREYFIQRCHFKDLEGELIREGVEGRRRHGGGGHLGVGTLGTLHLRNELL